VVTNAAGDPFEALGDPNRRDILRLLSEGDKPVSQIAAALPISRPAVSRHLRLLKEAGLVAEQARGTSRIYHLRGEGLRAVQEYLEQVWGDDLRVEGVVVEYLGGVDDLAGIVEDFQPGQGRRLGVLVDHLVAGSKEARIAEAVRRGRGGEHTLVVGHPFIDIWQAVKPGRLGISSWPVVPKGMDWKKGVCKAMGWPHSQQADIARAWQRIRGRVRDWNDLEPALIGRVEELIDFVTQP